MLDLNKEILNNNLYGVDINEESIEITKLSLWLKTAERGKPLESLDANFIAGNSLGFDAPAPGSSFYWKQAFKTIFDQGGFDVVLGNPPYVRMELLKEIKPWLKKNYQVVSDRLDLYGYFFELGSRLLKANGRLAYISSATFFKTGSGEYLRQYLSSEVSLEKIIDFGDVQVFEGVTTYPAILVLQNKKPESNHKIEILAVRDKLPENLQLSFEQEKGQMKNSQLGSESWQLENQSLHTLRNKLTESFPTLKDIYGSPLYGIKTGYNEAFVIDRNTRDAIVQQDPKSTNIIKPFLEGKDLKRWHSQSRNLFLINIPKGVLNIDDYPAIKNWLMPFKDKLEKRATKQEWFELQQAQLAYQPYLEKPKIFYPDITDSYKFHIDTRGTFSSNTGYFLPISDEGVTAYLNSRLIWFFLLGICDSVRGGFLRMFTQNIQEIPIHPKFSSQNEIFIDLERRLHDLAETRYQCEQNFARRLADLCPEDQIFKLNKKLQNWWLLDFSALQKELNKAFKASIPLAQRNGWQDYFETEQRKRGELNNEIAVLEQELNQQVYALFKLSQDEITLIEATIK